MRRRFVVIAVVAALTATACGRDTSSGDRSDAKADAGQASAAVPHDSEPPLVQPEGEDDGTVSMGNPECVEVYGPETLARRDFAFDGTLTSVEPSPEQHLNVGTGRLTFSVKHWYRGSEAPTIVLRTSGLGMFATPDGFQAHTGDRLLVSGEEDIAWICGFSQPWSPERAAEWEGVFG